MSLPGLYIHVPFCGSKCGYCSFYSIADHTLLPEYTKAVCHEIELRPGDFQSVDTVYFGGGTPPVLGTANLQTIVAAIHDNIAVNSCNEWTIEANPNGADSELFSGLLATGFNRLNIGIQSFNDGVLQYLGRAHKSEEAVRAFREARRAGFGNIGLDLIYGVPGQDMDCWMKSLEKAVDLAPEHLSCYQLTIERGTPLGRRLSQGEFVLPGEDPQYEFFVRTSEFLERNGYTHYEISNFSRGPEFASRHNQKYWDHTPYLGLGPSAHSFSGRERWWNVADVGKYIDMLEGGALPREDSEPIGPKELCLEMIALGLRTRKGICLTRFEQTRGRRLDAGELGSLHSLSDNGYLSIIDGWLRPTLKGMAVADRLAVELSDLLDR